MNIKRKVFLASLFLVCAEAQADVWAEREALDNISKEIGNIELLVIDAKKQANPKDRTTFDYRVLVSDLRKIRKGINDHLTVPMEPIVPSNIDALNANYTEHQ